MPPFRLCARSGITLAFAFVLAASGTPAEPQEARDADRPQTSVRGTLLSVNHRTNTVIMKSDEGQNLSWRFDRDVVKEAEGFEEGHPMIVIYRQLSGNVKRVTAVAFPGAAKTPTYVNMTGGRVTLRSAPALGGACDDHVAGDTDVTETVIPKGGRAEVLKPCWCCAVAGESCSATTRSGVGRAYLVRCFK